MSCPTCGVQFSLLTLYKWSEGGAHNDAGKVVVLELRTGGGRPGGGGGAGGAFAAAGRSLSGGGGGGFRGRLQGFTIAVDGASPAAVIVMKFCWSVVAWFSRSAGCLVLSRTTVSPSSCGSAIGGGASMLAGSGPSHCLASESEAFSNPGPLFTESERAS